MVKMGAKELHPVQIMCVLSESQIDEIVSYISKSLPSNLDDLSDIDKPMFDETIRVCVYFKTGLYGNLEIGSVEIQNSYWDVLPNDSFVLSDRLANVVGSYNRGREEAYNQGKQINDDQYF